jgi:uncharacterized protein (UPF0276 family)
VPPEVESSSRSAGDPQGPITRPGLAVTYEGEGVSSLERVLPLIDYVEVTPDGVAEDQGGGAVLNGAAMANIKAVSSKAKVLVHGVGLSIGSHEGYSEQYITLLDQFVKQVDVHWHSEHLGYTMVDKENLGTMLAVPKTQEVLDMICKRVSEIQDRNDLPFLLENVVHILPDYPGDYSEAEFLNALVEKTGCGLLLDVYNLECDAHNHGFDIDRFLDELDLEYVREIHVACGVEHRGLLLDIHSRRLRDSTVRLMRKVVDSAQGAVEVVTYELVSEAVPVLGHDLIAEELKRLREALL